MLANVRIEGLKRFQSLVSNSNQFVVAILYFTFGGGVNGQLSDS